MKYVLLLVVLILFSSITQAETIYKTEDKQGNSLRLFFERECTLLPLKKWKEAILVHKGKTYKACWRNDLVEVSVIDEEEDITYVPLENFVKEDPI